MMGSWMHKLQSQWFCNSPAVCRNWSQRVPETNRNHIACGSADRQVTASCKSWLTSRWKELLKICPSLRQGSLNRSQTAPSQTPCLIWCCSAYATRSRKGDPTILRSGRSNAGRCAGPKQSRAIKTINLVKFLEHWWGQSATLDQNGPKRQIEQSMLVHFGSAKENRSHR